jgi:hypothetical protein
MRKNDEPAGDAGRRGIPSDIATTGAKKMKRQAFSLRGGQLSNIPIPLAFRRITIIFSFFAVFALTGPHGFNRISSWG